MAKPVAGDVVIIPFPHTDLAPGKRRPALVVASAPGPDLILCQITTRQHTDTYAVLLGNSDFVTGSLTTESCVRPTRLFTADQSIVIYTAARVSDVKLAEVRGKLRQLFR